MKYFYSLIILSLLGVSFLHAQSNFKPGYVVNTSNDTLKGFVDYREWLKNPNTISFKSAVNGELKEYSISNANAFGVTNLELYEKYTVQVSNSRPQDATQTLAADTTSTTKTVFLKVINKGNFIALYSYADDLKRRFYVIDVKTKQVDELKYYAYFNEATNAVKTVNSYQRQLSGFAAVYQPGNQKVISQITGSEYNENDLNKIFNAINGSKNERIAGAESKSGTRFFVGIAGRSTKLTFSGADAIFPDGTNKSSFSPVLSGGLDLLANQNTQKLFFRLELQFAANSFDFPKTAVGADGEFDSLNFKQYELSLIPQIGYNFYAAENFKAFVSTGASLNFSAYNNYKYISYYRIGTTKAQEKFPDFKSFALAIPIKAGVTVNKHIEIYGLYLLKSTMTQYLGTSANATSYQAGVNYIFGK